MTRTLFISAILIFGLSVSSCHSHCKSMRKTNEKLIAGKHDFGKKTGKWKRKQNY